MRLAVADEDAAVLIHKDAVWPGELAVERVVAIRAVTFLAIAEEHFEGSLFHIEVTNGMRFGVGEIDIPLGIEAHRLGTSEPSFERRTTIAGEARFTRACDAFERVRFRVEQEQCVAFTQGEVALAIRTKSQRTRAIER